jgi:protein-disulfide isomerase/uncharacterized membrane protein
VRSRAPRAVVWVLAVASCLAGMRVSLKLTYIYLQESEDYVLEKAPGVWSLLGLQEVVSRGSADSKSTAAEGKAGGETWLDSMCSATETASCEEVAKSGYAAVPFNAQPGKFRMPVSLLGMFYFTAVLVWLVLVGGCSPSRWWVHLLLVAATFAGVGASAFFEYIMWKQLPHWCPLCVMTHALSLLLLVFALLLWPRRPAEERGFGARGGAPSVSRFAPVVADWPPMRMLPAAACLVLAAVWGEFVLLAPGYAGQESSGPRRTPASKPFDEKAMMAALASQPADSLAKQIVELRTKLYNEEGYSKSYKRQLDFYEKHWQHLLLSWRISPQVRIDTVNRPFRGPADARYTMVVYSDFQCPACKNFEDYLNEKLLPLSERGGRVRFVFKYWPICTDCNSHATRNTHPAACKAALAAEAALVVGGDQAYWKMYDLLWKTQPRWKDWKNNQDFNILAREVGLDEQAFQRAMGSPEALARIKADIAEGANLGKDLQGLKPEDLEFIKVNSTPAIFVDNKRLWRPVKSDSLWTMMFGMPTRTTGTPVSPTGISPAMPGSAPAQ